MQIESRSAGVIRRLALGEQGLHLTEQVITDSCPYAPPFVVQISRRRAALLIHHEAGGFLRKGEAIAVDRDSSPSVAQGARVLALESEGSVVLAITGYRSS